MTTFGIRSSAVYASAATEASAAVPLPAGYQPGDILYAGYELTAAGGVVTVPAGWSEHVPQFRSAGTTNSLHGVLGRIADGTEGTSVTVSFTSGRFAAVAAAVQGADSILPEDGVAPTADTNSGVAYPSVRAPSVTPVSPADLLLTFHAVRNGTNGASTTFVPPAGMAAVNQATSAVAGVSNAAITACSLALTSGAATGTKTATATSSSGSLINPMGSAIVLRPAAVKAASSPAVTAADTSAASAAPQATSVPSAAQPATSAPTVR